MSRFRTVAVALVLAMLPSGFARAQEAAAGPLDELQGEVTRLTLEASSYLVRVIRPNEVPRSFTREQPLRVIGTGISLGDGIVLTCASVVGPATEVLVAAADGDTIPARVVGVDWRTNVAVIKNDGLNLPAAPAGERSLLFPGDLVVSVGWGAPGFPRSAFGTIALVEGLNLGYTEVNMIEVTCPIYPGFTGGALIDRNGGVIGLVSGRIAVTPEQTVVPPGVNVISGYLHNESVSSADPSVVTLAVPLARALDIAHDILVLGYVERGYLGVEVQMVEETRRRAPLRGGGRNLRGVLVHNVVEDGPATAAGLIPGDVILEYAGARVQSPEDLSFLVGATLPGSQVPVEYLRRGQRGVAMVMIDQAPDLTWSPEMDRFLSPPLEPALAPTAR